MLKIDKQVLILCLLLIFSGCSQKQEKIYRVGILCGLDFIIPITDSFKAKMTELGYIEGENIIYDFQSTNFEPEKEKQILEKFVKDKVDLIFTFPTEVSMVAKAATEDTNIPVLFCFANIEGTGLVDSVQAPGGHTTGVRYPGPDLAIRRFEILRETVPDAKTVWIPYQRGYPIVQSQLDAINPAAEDVTIIEFPADNVAEVNEELNKDNFGYDSILFLAEPLTATADVYETLAEFAHEQKIPIGGLIIPVGEFSTMFSVNVQLDDIGEKSAILADKILSGVPAGTIPVVSAEQYFEINPSAAEHLGVTIPERLISLADNVIS